MGPDDIGAAQASDADNSTLCPTCGGKVTGPISAAAIAKSAGFPMAGSAPPSSGMPPMPSARTTPTLNSGVGTTEIIPGGTDIVRSLFSDLLPSASAAQAGSRSVINANKVPGSGPTGYPDPSRMQSITAVRG